MALSVKKVTHAAERQAFSVVLDRLLKKIEKSENRTEEIIKIIDMAQPFFGKAADPKTIENIKAAAADPENRWFKFINRVLDETNPHVAKMMLLNLGYESFLRGTKMIRKNREKYHCNIPWLILFDPTNACNMHCAGCWSGTYGHKTNMSYEDMDKIVTQGKELGAHLFMMTGGEPLMRRKDILRLAQKHNDCEFSLYTNSTLIDETLCEEVVRLGNITFQLSIEGTPDTNDARRGDGHYQAVMHAMDLLQQYGIVFGTSICYTRENIDAETDPEFIRFIAEKGARFGFFFHYMPVGKNAVPSLMPTVEQRKQMIERIRYFRSDECDIGFYPMDFQNDGEFVGGCIAGGRNYFHINANGDAEPCVFIHFSDSNIKDKSILEMLQSPLFMAYHEGQPFNRNHLRPCPMLENPQYLRQMVEKTGAKGTNDESEETADELCSKCDEYASTWGAEAEKIWAEQTHKKHPYENYTEEKREHPELAGFEHAE